MSFQKEQEAVSSVVSLALGINLDFQWTGGNFTPADWAGGAAILSQPEASPSPDFVSSSYS